MTLLCRYLLVLLGALFTAIGTFQSATAIPAVSDDIAAFFELSDNPEKTTEFFQVETDPSVRLMRDLFESVVNSDPDRLSSSLVQLGEDYPQTPQAIRIRDFAELTLSDLKQFLEDGDNSQLLATLQQYSSSEDWYLSSIAASLSAFLVIPANDFLVAAEFAENAMSIIPTELSLQATDARLRASEIMMILHGAQGNPAFMLETAKIQKTTKAQLGETINRYELMTNFLFALNRVRDFEGAAKIAELLLHESRPDDAIPGLAETYMADTFNELGDYQRSLELSEIADAESEHPVIRRRAIRAQVVALAGLGKESRARELMAIQDWSVPKQDLLSKTNLLTQRDREAITFAEALMAANRGETEFALALMKRRADLLVDAVQSANSSDMSSLLSNLENTRGRQAEREGALQREAELRAEQLKQKNRVNRMLWVLIGLLTIAFNFLLAFLRYRMKLSGKVQGLQKEALSAEKMKTEFLGVINHELRTPLNGIIGISDAMIHHAEDPALKKQAEAVQQSGQVLFNLLDSLITMSTIEGNRLSLEPDETDLSKALRREAREWETAAQNKGLVFTSHIGPELQASLMADEKRIRRAVNYLLSNAVRFTHDGRIHLHATGTPDDQGQMRLKIIVADTGQGMSEEVQSRLFMPFLQADAYMTRKYGGAGLSLAIARKLARMMDGDLTVTSREGRGSEFVLTAILPQAAAASETKDSETASALERPTLSSDKTYPARSEKIVTDLMESGPKSLHAAPIERPRFNILLADPGGLPSRSLRQALQALNGKMIETHSAQDLIANLEVGNFDAVLVNLDHRHIDLETLAPRIRRLENPSRDIPIIAVSDSVESDHAARLKSAGVDLILPLSLSPSNLSEALSETRNIVEAA